MAIGGGLTGAVTSASISYAYGVRGWRNLGASAFSGMVSGAVLGAAYGFSIGTGRFPVVFVEGLAAAASNAFSSFLSQLIIEPFSTPDGIIVGTAFIDGLMWGTAASAFGGTFIWKNGSKVFEDDMFKQVQYAMLTSFGKDTANYVVDVIQGGKNLSFGDFFVGALINAGKAGMSVAVLNHVISESNIPESDIAWAQIATSILTNSGIGTWIDVARDYVLENFIP